jgi:hypothetical protein
VDVRLRRALAAPLVLAVALAAGAGAASASPLETAPRCQILPRTNVWNKRVDALPLHPRSDEIVAAIGADDYVHADFGSGLWNGGPIGIPVTVVGKSQRRVPVRFRYADESDRGPYPIPRAVRIEGGPRATGDRHALIVNRATCKLYELFALRKRNGRWQAGSGAIFDLRSNKLRPRGWTSADAAGLPILPGLARYSEVRKGVIDHALRFSVERTRKAYVYPARHQASDLTDPDLPPMGMRFRLRADFPVSGYPRQARIVLVALKRYGMIVADNGSNWYVSGVPNARWSNDQLHSLHGVHGSDFEVVDTSGLRNG